jgi:ATP-dependent Lon protease
MPGKIIASLKRCGTSNPVILLDEIDKMSNDFRGDPASALLEVLDPEQNGTFVDHYLDLDYDLSQILFICTANNLSGISQPLLDRMEMIRISGYTDYEKAAIAKTYLIPKQLEANGLAKYEPVDKRDKKGRRVQEKGAKITFDEESVRKVIEHYTREAGVRNLERAVGTCCRKAAILLLKRIEEDAPAAISENKESDDDTKGKAKEYRRAQLEGRTLRITPKRVREFLGIEKFKHREQEKTNKVGLTHGLAWTSVGGEVLVTEVALVPGKGKLTITGKLGDVMQESAQAAMTYVRSRATALGLAKDFYNRLDIHIHVPAGGTPKDGPSAGITLATSLVSALTRVPVRHDVAMTGEITLRGQVMAIGGLKEKALAAYRQGILTILMPAENEKDLEEIPNSIRSAMTFIPVENVDEVVKHALALEGTELLLADLSEAVVDILDEITPEVKPVTGRDTEAPAGGVH